MRSKKIDAVDEAKRRYWCERLTSEVSGGWAVNGANLEGPKAVERILPGYLRPPLACAYIGISLRTLRYWTRAGIVPCIRPGGGRVLLYAKADLDKCLLRFREGVRP